MTYFSRACAQLWSFRSQNHVVGPSSCVYLTKLLALSSSEPARSAIGYKCQDVNGSYDTSVTP